MLSSYNPLNQKKKGIIGLAWSSCVFWTAACQWALADPVAPRLLAESLSTDLPDNFRPAGPSVVTQEFPTMPLLDVEDDFEWRRLRARDEPERIKLEGAVFRFTIKGWTLMEMQEDKTEFFNFNRVKQRALRKPHIMFSVTKEF